MAYRKMRDVVPADFVGEKKEQISSKPKGGKGGRRPK